MSEKNEREKKNIFKQSGKRNLVMLDVDSKDNTAGISCPPEVFLQLEFL